MVIDLQHTVFLVIFSSVAYLIVTEEYFLHYIYLISKIIRVRIERIYWLIRLHPRFNNNFISRWIMYRKYNRIAKELEKEFNDKV
jgi:hypothetical protein